MVDRKIISLILSTYVIILVGAEFGSENGKRPRGEDDGIGDVDLPQGKSMPASGILPRIGGGNIASLGQFPYHVFVIFYEDGQTKLCEGSILAEQYVLTTATCTYSINSPSDIFIGAGSTVVTRDSPVVLRNVTDVWIHPYYQPYSTINDISLLKLKEKLDFSGPNIKPIKIGTENVVHPGTQCKVSGYGATTWDQNIVDKNLRSVTVSVVGNVACSQLWEVTIRDGNMCAGNLDATGIGPFQSDIGGPLVCEDELYGIVSDIREDKPAIYVEVNHYSAWILGKMGKLPDDKGAGHSEAGSLCLVAATVIFSLALYKRR